MAERFLSAGYSVAWLGGLRHIGQTLKNGGAVRTLFKKHADGVLEIDPFSRTPLLRQGGVPGGIRLISTKLAFRSATRGILAAFAESDHPSPDVVWTTGGDAGMLARAFPSAKVIVQCVDVYEAYGGKGVIPIERADYAAADHIVTIGESLARFIVHQRGVSREKITVVGQGADLELFANSTADAWPLEAMPRPRLVWVGLLDKADLSLMEASLAGLPDQRGSLVLVGPSAQWSDELASRDKRVFLLGPKPAADVATILKSCDVGLMLYDRKRNPLQYVGQNPLKLYEMAAAGLPIVSTSHSEYEFVEHPALVADSEESVVLAVRKALTERRRMSDLSLSFADKNGWGKRFQEAENLVLTLAAGR